MMLYDFLSSDFTNTHARAPAHMCDRKIAPQLIMDLKEIDVNARNWVDSAQDRIIGGCECGSNRRVA